MEAKNSQKETDRKQIRKTSIHYTVMNSFGHLLFMLMLFIGKFQLMFLRGGGFVQAINTLKRIQLGFQQYPVNRFGKKIIPTGIDTAHQLFIV